jgi:hypothetical protein
MFLTLKSSFMYFFVVEFYTFLLNYSRGGLPMTENGAAWQAYYQAALLELDPEKLPQRVEAAETTIFKRLQDLAYSSNSHAERQAIEDAVASLRVLKQEILAFPDWEKK